MSSLGSRNSERGNPMINHVTIPNYFWYTSATSPTGENRCHFYNGQWYSAYINEPDTRIINKYKMTFVGIGDVSFPETYSNRDLLANLSEQ